MNIFCFKLDVSSTLPIRQQVLAAANNLHRVISSLQGLDVDPHWSHQSALVAMVEHHSIIGEGKTNGISYIEFVITNDISIL